MMYRLRRMLGMQTAGTMLPSPVDSPELAAAKRRHRELLSRADEAIKEAMAHADEAFGPPSPVRVKERRW